MKRSSDHQGARVRVSHEHRGPDATQGLVPDISTLSPITSRPDEIWAVIETPQGSSQKFDYDPATGLFTLVSVLPVGMVFPVNFGFVPGTLAGDGDPVDALAIMDGPAFAGCLVRLRLLGAIEARQRVKGGSWERNDRIVGVAVPSLRHHALRKLKDLPGEWLKELVHFFVTYNALKDKTFEVLRLVGIKEAMNLVERGLRERRKLRRPSIE